MEGESFMHKYYLQRWVNIFFFGENNFWFIVLIKKIVWVKKELFSDSFSSLSCVWNQGVVAGININVFCFVHIDNDTAYD